MAQFVVFMDPTVIEADSDDAAMAAVLKSLFAGTSALDVMSVEGVRAPKRFVDVRSWVALDIAFSATPTEATRTEPAPVAAEPDVAP